MAPRLQGELAGDGGLRLAIWGAGDVGSLRIAGLEGPFVIAPNRIEARNGAGVWVAQSEPVLAIKGARPERVRERDAGRMLVSAQPEGWLVAAGMDAAEAAKGMALDFAQVVREADDYVARCDLAPTADPLLRSMVVQGVHAALSSVRSYPGGSFAGLSTAGTGLFDPGPHLLPRRLLDTAAAGPPGARGGRRRDRPAGDQRAGRRRGPQRGDRPGAARGGVRGLPAGRAGPSGGALAPRRVVERSLRQSAVFVIAVGDHVAATGDYRYGAAPLAKKLLAVFRRYMALRGAGDLPVKPHPMTATGPTTSIARAWSPMISDSGSARWTCWRGSVRHWTA